MLTLTINDGTNKEISASGIFAEKRRDASSLKAELLEGCGLYRTFCYKFPNMTYRSSDDFYLNGPIRAMH